MDEMLQIPLDIQEESIIKVIGVGGGGCNAVNYMYAHGIQGVSFLVCNTDKQCLGKSSVPAKLQLGPGLGAGGEPGKAEEYADGNRDHIREALNDGTKMLFITAGMGGGTGTGASPIVAEVARELGILTVAIVTIPFAFEGDPKIRKAMTGVARLAEHVDAILVINNEKLTQIYSDLSLLNAFSKSDDVVCNAAKAIAEIITVPSEIINTDFQDVYNTLKNGNVAIMNVGRANGEDRITHAIENALNSPLVRTSDVHGAKRVLIQLYCSREHAIIMEELSQVHQFVAEVGEGVEVQWGVSIDDTLGEDVRITIIATGYEVSDIPSLTDVVGKPTVDDAVRSYYAEEQEKPSEPKEDEQATVIDIPIDNLPEVNLMPEKKEEKPVTQPKPESFDSAEIKINIEPEEEEKETTPREEESSRPKFGWFRGR